MSLLGTIVGGVLGLFGNKKQKTETTSTVDYASMVQRAEAAGFNPLTALRNGGSAGFTTSTTTAPSTSALPGALQSIGGALGDALSDKLDPVAKKQRQLDTALVDYQLRQLKEGPRTAGTLYPGSTFQGTKVARTQPVMGASRKVASYMDEQRPTQTDNWAWTNGWLKPAPYRVDAAAYEDAYGDLTGSLLGGVIPVGQDVAHNVSRGAQWYNKQILHGEGIKTRPLTKAEQKAIDDSWIPSWVPRFSFK